MNRQPAQNRERCGWGGGSIAFRIHHEGIVGSFLFLSSLVSLLEEFWHSHCSGVERHSMGLVWETEIGYWMLHRVVAVYNPHLYRIGRVVR